jgi:hypothetical protein
MFFVFFLQFLSVLALALSIKTKNIILYAGIFRDGLYRFGCYFGGVAL